MASDNDIIYSPTLANKSSLASSITDQYGEITNSSIKSLMAAQGLFDSKDNSNETEWRYKFSRFPFIDPYNTMGVTHEYVFFTKPDLHLLNTSTKRLARALQNYTFFTDVYERYYHLLEQLQSSANTYSSAFMNLLSNTLRGELDIPELEAENDLETGANVYGTKITYRGNSYAADQEHNFSLEFEDNKYLEVYMLFKIYDEYCRLKNIGMIDFSPSDSDDAHWIQYTLNKVLHDQFSIYKFITSDDGMNLIYWGKYTGVYPTGAPRNAFSNMDGGPQKLTVSFKAQFFRDMDPSILAEFNRIGIYTKNRYYYADDLPLFDSLNNTIDGTWSSMPYIYSTPTEERVGAKGKIMRYQLRWKV